ncbi:MAG TPA: hypothetical protein VK524_24230 [Polyangiaceae bacterium]|nr:hypothetical protein [Polyangiaceae bacterium]
MHCPEMPKDFTKLLPGFPMSEQAVEIALNLCENLRCSGSPALRRFAASLPPLCCSTAPLVAVNAQRPMRDVCADCRVIIWTRSLVRELADDVDMGKLEERGLCRLLSKDGDEEKEDLT